MIDVFEIADNLKISKEGIWESPNSSEFEFLPDDQTDWAKVQQNSFWYRHRNDIFKEIFNLFPPSGTMLEVGAGEGFVSLGIQESGIEIVAVEPDIKRAVYAKQSGVENVISARLEDVEWKTGCVGGIGFFDVLEHIEDDVALLKQAKGMLKAGGRIYLSVPAHRWLWSKEDEEAHHVRRYTRGELQKKLEDAGFKIEYTTYFFSSLVIPVLFFRSLPSLIGIRKNRTHLSSSEEHQPKKRPVRNVLNYFLDREVKGVRNKSVKFFGASCLAVACVV